MFISKNIKTLRLQKKTTQGNFAEMLGLTRGQIASYEMNTTPPLDIVMKIANFFNIKIDDLVNIDLSTVKELSIEMTNKNNLIYKSQIAKGENIDMRVNEPETRYGTRNEIMLREQLEALKKQLELKDQIIKSKEEFIEFLKSK